MKKLLLASTILTLSTPAFADNIKDYAEIGYQTMSIDGIDSDSGKSLKPKGFKLEVSKDFGVVYGTISYLSTEKTLNNSSTETTGDLTRTSKVKRKFEIEQLSIEIGKVFNFENSLYLDIHGGYTRNMAKASANGEINVSNPSLNLSETLPVNISTRDSANAIRFMTDLGKTFEKFYLEAGIGFEHIRNGSFKETNFVYSAQAGYKFTDAMSINLEFRDAKDYEGLAANFRYHF
ncbi:outer membrane beta-barrel protein [Parashewanella tropica]|uniref:outer membrane beta-barrel protein n=1 Tax=Parashewanella tropica TaxID=2547970 RepID=UPI001059E719|nr:outer membrane beta-barrel protein [Parashewanella tropica]